MTDHYRFARARMVQGPLDGALRPLRPLWHEVASVVGLIAFLALCVLL